MQNLVSPSPYKNPLRDHSTGEDASGPSLILLNHVNFLSFDNDDMKPSKRQFTFLSLISGLNHNINKHNLAKFGFALSLQKPIKGRVERRERLCSQPNFTELSLKLSNYELRTLFNEANCGLRITPSSPLGVTVITGIKKGKFSINCKTPM